MSQVRNNKPRRKSAYADVWRYFRRNKLAMTGLIVLILFILVSIFAPFLAPYDYSKQDLGAAYISPNIQHPMGTDNLGRDIFSRVLWGGRYTLLISAVCATAAMLIGCTFGLLAAYIPKIDNLLMRFIDILMGLPILLFSMSIISALGSSLVNMMIAVTVISIAPFARIMHAQVLTLKNKEFIEATESIGANNLHIILHHIIPNALAPVIVQFTLSLVTVILNSAGLSFIGMGIQPPTPEWGLMISAGRAYLRDYWYMSILPGLAIVATTLAMNFIGDGIRDALDPRLR